MESSSEIRQRRNTKEKVEEEEQERDTSPAQKQPTISAEQQQRDLLLLSAQTYDSLSFVKDAFITVALIALSVPVRLNALDNPSEVVFDEVHFGTFANQYIQRRFFFDVHPPLAKMLIALAGWIAGYKGDFDFSAIGNNYLSKDVPYVAMRSLGACLGLAVVPMAYLTLRFGGHSIAASMFAALVVCYENSLVTNNRFILLDAYLLFFTALTIMAWNGFHRERSRPFGARWWFWLAMTGVGLGLTVSCKWVGLFTIATIGCSTVLDLWKLLGNLHVSQHSYVKHIAARALFLICVPISIYIAAFYAHFLLVPLSGDGDVHMSAQFQHSLVGRKIDDSPADVAYGSRITIRHVATNGGYLHSHLSTYPDGSKQQQITLYPYMDENNWWTIRKMNSTLDAENEPADKLGSDNETWLEWVRNGDIVRLEHVMTAPRKLHSHDEKAPVTDAEYHKEVSAYGFPDYEGDANDYWRVEIEQDGRQDKESNGRLQTLKSRFKLVHLLQSCALFSHEVKLPEWGYGQQEVTCIQSGKKPKILWMIEQSENDLLPEGSDVVNYEPMSFWEKFVELHRVMWRANKGLTDSHPFESRPSSWPTLLHGISLWANHLKRVFLLGNPVVYWTSTVAVFNYFIIWAFFRLRSKRGYRDHYNGRRAFFESSAGFYVVGWLLHYLPFYLMDRQLFSHHYLPALYFSILVLSTGLDLVFTRFSPKSRLLCVVILATLVISAFRIYAPITYGTQWTREQCQDAQWLPTWTFGCEMYPSIKATEAPVSSDDKVNKLKTVVAALDDLQNTVTVQTLNMETHIFSNK
ncbi:hypothetical protein VTP01DRAFT_9116 [Rhizomucor pusillus]|uniref:uncharacterized protein n=1 Tax=Rhizomucor pusillus TaxID=4840 RepID=UPI00374473BF